MPRSVEVLVIGAGPAGSAAALRLTRAGREVLLVDRCRFPRPKPCGEYFNPECARLLRELDLLPAVWSAGAREVAALALGGAARGLTVPLAGLSPTGDRAFSLGREVLDTLLLEAAGRAGVTVWEAATVREPLLEGERVTGARVEVEGQSREVRACLTLAADGLRSRFARCLGLAAGDGGRRKFGITARYAARPGAPERIEMQPSRGGCCGLVVRGREANLGMVVDGSQARALGGDPARFFRQALEGYPALAGYLEGGPGQVRTVGPLTWITRRQHAPGCLLLGDAAGFYDPFTGQGVTFALLTAGLAAEVGERALAERDVSPRRLAEYTRRRRALLEPRLLVQRVIQLVLERPRLLAHVLERLDRRPEAARTLIGVVADVLPASRTLSPRFLAQLLL